MQGLFRVSTFVGVFLFLIACGRASQAAPTPVASPSPTFVPTITPSPSPSATATLEPAPTQAYPTLIPIVDPTLAPKLLNNAFSIQTVEGANGHSMRQITGWEYGFGGGVWQGSCPGYYWLDANHLLLYPVMGQVPPPEGFYRSRSINVASQPVVINLETGAVWLPPVNEFISEWSCMRVYWSQELEILITSATHDHTSSVSTYTYDGLKLASYAGNLVSISPSRTKILLDDNTLVDLRRNKAVTLDWSLEDYYEQVLSGLFWTSDETRIYRCCYFYADLTTGISHRFERSDFQFTDGTHLNPDGLWFYRGQWVRNDTYFLVEWTWLDDGDIRYLPMLDPAKKIFYEVRERAGISDDWMCYLTTISPDGKYVWMTGEIGSYLVNLSTFEARYYPGSEYRDIDWSPNSKFAWVGSTSSLVETNPYNLLSIADLELKPLPVKPLPEWSHWWHASNNVLIYPSEKENVLILLDASTMSFQELSFTLQGPYYAIDHLAWSPNGKQVALAAEDGSVWQVGYPKLENLEQLTPLLSDAREVNWSPDGNSIAFVSGSDIYIVDTIK